MCCEVFISASNYPRLFMVNMFVFLFVDIHVKKATVTPGDPTTDVTACNNGADTLDNYTGDDNTDGTITGDDNTDGTITGDDNTDGTITGDDNTDGIITGDVDAVDVKTTVTGIIETVTLIQLITMKLIRLLTHQYFNYSKTVFRC